MTEKLPAEPLVQDYIQELTDALFEQLNSDQKRWGDTWLRRPREGQEERTFARFQDYMDQFRSAGQPVPWLKLVGGALICWIREQHPELSDEWQT